MKFKAC